MSGLIFSLSILVYIILFNILYYKITGKTIGEDTNSSELPAEIFLPAYSLFIIIPIIMVILAVVDVIFGTAIMDAIARSMNMKIPD